jgi:hypothetical protein
MPISEAPLANNSVPQGAEPVGQLVTDTQGSRADRQQSKRICSRNEMITTKVKRRKAIPDRVKLLATLREMGLKIDEIHYDHNPALELRGWDEERRDTIPPANDAEHIDLMMIRDIKRCNECGRSIGSHHEKTFGTKATTAGSDIHRIAKMRRLTKKQEEFRSRVMAKVSPDDIVTADVKKKPKQKIPNRGFPKRVKPK